MATTFCGGRRRRTGRWSKRRGRPVTRKARLELLEPRWFLNAGPLLNPLDDLILYGGAPLHIALSSEFSGDGGLTYSVTTNNADLTAEIPQGNRSMKITVAEYGDMVFELFEDLAPRTTGRIIELIESGFYDGLIFHRIIDGFMIQGGDPTGTGTGGSGVKFDDEYHPLLMHTSAGVLSMAKSADDTNDSQFFITDAATRHLDFNHSVFGFLTAGDDVRKAISQMATDAQDRPLDDVVMESVTTFVDAENGVLRLSAPHGYTGTAQVTVTVTDAEGITDSQTFNVVIQKDNQTTPPFLLPIDPIHTAVDTPTYFELPAWDRQGNPLYFAGLVYPENAHITVDLSEVDGQGVVTPSGGLVGVHSIYVGVRARDGYQWDTQLIPLFIHPAAPSQVRLLASSDTGVSSSDGITALNNSDSGKVLHFRVSDVLEGATVRLYAGETFIGEAVADADEVVIQTDGGTLLTDGVHQITARQFLQGQEYEVGNESGTVDLASGGSAALSITIDTAAPEFTSAPVEAAAEGLLYQYQVTTNEDPHVVYGLKSGPAGMTIDAQTGLLTWTPQPGQGPLASVVVAAQDLAGNESQQAFEITIKLAPVIAPIADYQVDELSLLTFTVEAYDPDGAAITFSLGPGAPAGAAIDAETGVFTWTPSEAQGPGVFQIEVQATDEAGVTARRTFEVIVDEVNHPPELTPIADTEAYEHSPLTFQVEAFDPDIPANRLFFSLRPGAPEGARIDPDTGVFSWTPNELQGGHEFEIVVRVTDEHGAYDETTFSVEVHEVDRPPVIEPLDDQIAIAGEELAFTVVGYDPDIPTNPVRFSLDEGAPEGMAIDPETGRVEWDVPQDHPGGEYLVRVLVTEIWEDGTDGLSSTSDVRVFVTGPWELFFHAAELEALGASDPVEEEAVEALLVVEEESTSDDGSVRMAPLGGGGEEGVLGLQFSSRYLGGLSVDFDEDSEDNPSEREQAASTPLPPEQPASHHSAPEEATAASRPRRATTEAIPAARGESPPRDAAEGHPASDETLEPAAAARAADAALEDLPEEAVLAAVMAAR